eukprot:TRINITY_DN23630_c0_g5_i1.p1 TRINITY_DN23630_c0_g5~~TRINITY_DN23630_c0_g5_i1.p1  ORF type:complete len:1445 (-),score=201.93 TRINITY_DN23630_c0_g5_i1:229-4197(-)
MQEVIFSNDLPINKVDQFPEGVLRLGCPLYKWTDDMLTDRKNAQHREDSRNMMRSFRLYVSIRGYVKLTSAEAPVSDSVNSSGNGTKMAKKLEPGTFVPVLVHVVGHENTKESVERAVLYLEQVRGVRMLVWPYTQEDSYRFNNVWTTSQAFFMAPNTWSRANQSYSLKSMVYFIRPSPAHVVLAVRDIMPNVPGPVWRILIEEAPAYVGLQEHMDFHFKWRGSDGDRVPCTDSLANGSEGYECPRVYSFLKSDYSNLEEMMNNLTDYVPDILIVVASPEMRHQVLVELWKKNIELKSLMMVGAFEKFFRADSSVALEHVFDLIGWVPTDNVRLAGLANPDIAEDPSYIFASKFHEAYNSTPTMQDAAAFVAAEALTQVWETPSFPLATLPTIYGKTVFMDTYRKFDNMSNSTQKVAQIQNGEIVLTSHQHKGNKSGQDTSHGIIVPKMRWDDMACGVAPDGNFLRLTGVVSANRGYRTAKTTDRICTICSPEDGYVAVFDHTTHRSICQKCPPGQELVGFSEQLETARCTECPAGRYSSADGVQKCVDCGPGTYQDSNGADVCKQCPRGKFASESGARKCLSCHVFLQPAFAKYPGSSTCVPCKEGTECVEENNLRVDVAAKAGYTIQWNADADKEFEYEVLPCMYDGGKTCQKGGKCMVDSLGTEIMSGYLCGTCAKGYGRLEVMGRCGTCNSVGWSALGVFCEFVPIALVVAIPVLAASHSRAVEDIRFPVYKQVINHAVMATCTLEGAPLASGYFRYLGMLMRFLGGLLTHRFGRKSAECLAEAFLPHVPYWQVETIAGWIAVPLWLGTFTICRRIYTLVEDCRRQERSSAELHWVVGTVLVFVIHPRATRLVLVPISCFRSGGDPRLVADPSILCLSSTHLPWIIVSVLGFVVVSLGIPIGIMIAFKTRRLSEALADPASVAVRRCGFLICGFEQTTYIWEAVIMIMKAIFIAFASFDPHLHRFLFIVACCMMHASMKEPPYDNRTYFILGTLFHESWVANVITLYLQTCSDTLDTWPPFQRQDLRYARDLVFSITCIAFHLRFLLEAFWTCFAADLGRLINRTPRSRGVVEFTERGMKLHKLSSRAQRLLRTMIMEIMGPVIEGRSAFVPYDTICSSLKQIGVRAHYQRFRREDLKQKKLAAGSGRLGWFQVWSTKLQIMQGATRREFARLAMDFRQRTHERTEMEKKMGEDVINATSLKGIVDKAQVVARMQDDLKIDDAADLYEFTIQNQKRLVGMNFTVEELYNAMLQLGRSLGEEEHVDDFADTAEALFLSTALKEMQSVRERLDKELHEAEAGHKPILESSCGRLRKNRDS